RWRGTGPARARPGTGATRRAWDRSAWAARLARAAESSSGARGPRPAAGCLARLGVLALELADLLADQRLRHLRDHLPGHGLHALDHVAHDPLREVAERLPDDLLERLLELLLDRLGERDRSGHRHRERGLRRGRAGD